MAKKSNTTRKSSDKSISTKSVKTSRKKSIDILDAGNVLSSPSADTVKQRTPAFYDLNKDNAPSRVYDTHFKRRADVRFALRDKPTLESKDIHPRIKPKNAKKINQVYVNYEKTGKIIAFVSVFFVVIILVSLIFVFWPKISGDILPILTANAVKDVENGICKFRIDTYEGGKVVKKLIDLPGSTCRTADDCENLLRQQNLPEESIKELKLRCEERV